MGVARRRTPRDWRRRTDRNRRARTSQIPEPSRRRAAANQSRPAEQWLGGLLFGPESRPGADQLRVVVGENEATSSIVMSSAMRRISSALKNRIGAQPGVFLLTGGRGLGKSLLLRSLARELRAAGHLVILIDRPDIDLEDLLNVLSQEWSFSPLPTDLAELASSLRLMPMPGGGPGRAPVLLMDDADLLGDAMLLGLLPLIEGPADHKAFRLVLGGRAALAKRVQAPALARFRRRVVFKGELLPLDLGETIDFVRQRRSAMSATPEIEAAASAIAKLIRGRPGDATLIWDAAHKLAIESGSDLPTPNHVASVARRFQPAPMVPQAQTTHPEQIAPSGGAPRLSKARELRPMARPLRPRRDTAWRLPAMATAAALLLLALPTKTIDPTSPESTGDAARTRVVVAIDSQKPDSSEQAERPAPPAPPTASLDADGGTSVTHRPGPDFPQRLAELETARSGETRQTDQAPPSQPNATSATPPTNTGEEHAEGESSALATTTEPPVDLGPAGPDADGQALVQRPAEVSPSEHAASKGEHEEAPSEARSAAVTPHVGEKARSNPADEKRLVPPPKPAQARPSRQAVASTATTHASNPARPNTAISPTPPPTAEQQAKPPVSAELARLSTNPTVSGPQCLPYQSNADYASRGLQVHGVACRGTDGRWWLLNQTSG